MNHEVLSTQEKDVLNRHDKDTAVLGDMLEDPSLSEEDRQAGLELAAEAREKREEDHYNEIAGKVVKYAHDQSDKDIIAAREDQ